MPCTGGGPSKWEIDLKEQEYVTEKTQKLRRWLINKSKIKDDFVEDYPDFQEELRKQTDYNTSTGNPSANQPWRIEAVNTKNEQAKLCQVIRHLGEDKFYEIVEAAGLRSKQARDIVGFWQAHKKIDEARQKQEAEYTKAVERKNAKNNLNGLVDNMTTKAIQQLTERMAEKIN